MNPPLELLNYFFPHIDVSADTEFDPQNIKGPGDGVIEVRTEVMRADEDESLYQVVLNISWLPEDENKLTSYAVHLVTVGIFRVAPEWPDPKKLVEVNGASILYAAAREFIITVTSRGPWPALRIPTVSFLQNGTGKRVENKTK